MSPEQEQSAPKGCRHQTSFFPFSERSALLAQGFHRETAAASLPRLLKILPWLPIVFRTKLNQLRGTLKGLYTVTSTDTFIQPAVTECLSGGSLMPGLRLQRWNHGPCLQELTVSWM